MRGSRSIAVVAVMAAGFGLTGCERGSPEINEASTTARLQTQDPEQDPAAATTDVAEVTVTVTASPSPEETTPSEDPDATSTVEATTEPTPADGAQALPTSPDEYADAWIRAWGLGDDDAMSVYADRYVHGLFSGTAGGGTWQRNKSVGPGPYGQGVQYTQYVDAQSGNWAVVGTDPSLVAIGARHAVVDVQVMPPEVDGLSPMPEDDSAAWDGGMDEEPGAGTPLGLTTDPGAYADEFVRAWGAGDPDRADTYANVDGMTLFQADWTGGTDWVRQYVDQEFVVYSDTGGNQLTVVLRLDRVAAGASDGVVAAFIE